MAWVQDQDGVWYEDGRPDAPDPYSNYQGPVGPGGAWGYDPDTNSYLHNPDGSLAPGAKQTNFAPTLSGVDDGSQLRQPPPENVPGPGPGPGPGAVNLTPRSGGGYGVAGGKQFFSYPDWTPPEEGFAKWTPPTSTTTPFVGPTAETFTADPGYEFRVGEMDRAYKNNKSAQGLLQTGGTLADLMKLRGGLASQEFGNVWNRDYQKWGANKGLDDTNYAHGLTNYLTQEQAKSDDWTRSLQTYQTNLGKESSSYGLNLDTSQLNLARDNSGFGNLLSLYGLMTKNLPTYSSTV